MAVLRNHIGEHGRQCTRRTVSAEYRISGQPVAMGLE